MSEKKNMYTQTDLPQNSSKMRSIRINRSPPAFLLNDVAKSDFSPAEKEGHKI